MTMARTRRTLACDTNPDANPDAANAPDAPPAAGKDIESNLPDREEDDET